MFHKLLISCLPILFISLTAAQSGEEIGYSDRWAKLKAIRAITSSDQKTVSARIVIHEFEGSDFIRQSVCEDIYLNLRNDRPTQNIVNCKDYTDYMRPEISNQYIEALESYALGQYYMDRRPTTMILQVDIESPFGPETLPKTTINVKSGLSGSKLVYSVPIVIPEGAWEMHRDRELFWPNYTSGTKPITPYRWTETANNP